MKQKNRRRKKRRLLIRIRPMVLLVLAVAMAAAGLRIMGMGATPASAGELYLEEREHRDLDEVDDLLMELREKQRKEMLVHGDINIYSCFSNSVIMGDSRSYGFISVGKMNTNVNWSVLSTDITNMQWFHDSIKQAKPEVIYFNYGANDILRGIGLSEDEDLPTGYVLLYEKLIKDLRKGSPKSKIAINSVVPVNPALSAGWNDEYLDYVKRINKGLKELCERERWIFIDNDPLYEQWGEKMFSGDGTHYVTSFYNSWAINMLVSVYPEYEEATWVES